MEKVTLAFPSIRQLWNFRQSVSLREVEINFYYKTLIFEHNDDHINLAIEEYGAHRKTSNDLVSTSSH